MILELAIKFLYPFIKNWKTTSIGIAGILHGASAIVVAVYSDTAPDVHAIQIGIAEIVAGVGFIAAKDADKTGANTTPIIPKALPV